MFKKTIAIVLMLAMVVFASVALADQLMHAPTGVKRVSWQDGTSSTVDANGNIMVLSKNVPDAERAGFTVPQVPAASFLALTSTVTYTFTAANLTSAQYNVITESTGTTSQAWWLPTAAAISAAQLGQTSFTIQVINGNTAAGVITLNSSDPLVVLSGTATTAIAAYHEYIATFASPTWTISSAGTGSGVAP